jgi:uncharacterized protein
MKLDAMIRRLMPREERFQELLGQDTANLVRGARVFAEVAAAGRLEDRRVKVVELKGVEHEGDQITRRVFEALNSTFITPLDREDIRSLAKDLDDILDYLEMVGQYLVLFELHETPEALAHFARILVDMTLQIVAMTELLWDLANEKRIGEAIVRVSDLENEADLLYNTVIADLFKDRGRPPLDILKWKEIYDGLENACDKCKEYTHVVGNVVIKNA